MGLFPILVSTLMVVFVVKDMNHVTHLRLRFHNLRRALIFQRENALSQYCVDIARSKEKTLGSQCHIKVALKMAGVWNESFCAEEESYRLNSHTPRWVRLSLSCRFFWRSFREQETAKEHEIILTFKS